jgi:hypothetical protein
MDSRKRKSQGPDVGVTLPAYNVASWLEALYGVVAPETHRED